MFLPAKVQIWWFLILLELILIFFFAGLYYPLMEEKYFILPPEEKETNRFLLCVYQSVYLQFLTNVEYQPRTDLGKVIIMFQSFLSFTILVGAVVFVFSK